MTWKMEINKTLFWFLLILLLSAAVITRRFSVLGLAALAMIICASLDVVYFRLKVKRWLVPWKGLISALIIASLLSPSAPLIVWILAPIVAVASKRLIRPYNRPLFNPAAFSLAVLSLFFPHLVSWWVGGHWILIAYIIVGALIIWWRLKKWPIVITFALTYYLTLFLLYGASIIVAPWADPTVLFFAGVMLIEPMTSAFRRPSVRVLFAVIVGLSAVLYGLIPGFPVDLFLAAILTGNLLATIIQNRVK